MSQITIHMCQKQERSCLIRLLLCLSNPGSLPAQDPCQPKIPVCPRSQSAQDPSRPKIPVNPRSQSAQDPSQPKVPVSPRSQSAMDALMPIWLLPIWYLAPTYLIFGPCLFDIWLMPIWYLAHAKSASTKFFKHILHTYLDFSHSYLVGTCTFSQSKKHIWSSNIILCNILFYPLWSSWMRYVKEWGTQIKT